jgi:thiol-disulfide isomerase/thioredoxin
VRHLIPRLLLLAGCLLTPGPTLPLRADEPARPAAAIIEAARQFTAIEEEWTKAQKKYEAAMRQANTKAERDAVAAKLRPDPKPYTDRCLRVFGNFPDTWGGAAALYWVACNDRDPKAAGQALAKLKDGPVAKGELGILNSLFFFQADLKKAPARELAPLLYDRVAGEPSHPKAADLLVWVCRVAAEDPSPAGTKLLHRAGELLVSRYPDAKYLWRFCKVLQDAADPAWAERHLRTILKAQNPAARVAGSFALASLLQNKDEAAQPEAEQLYRRVVEEAAKVADDWNQAAYKLVETFHEFPDGDRWVEPARSQLEEMKVRGLGKPVPDLTGDDLDGKAMRLADYRGKVVLLTFWASWCGPCLDLVPHERELVKKHDGRPFVVVGANGDKDLAAARKVAAKEGITWRSFRDRRESAAPISEEWAVAGWPTLYLIDDTGVIRKRWVGAPPFEVLSREVERLVVASERGK